MLFVYLSLPDCVLNEPAYWPLCKVVNSQSLLMIRPYCRHKRKRQNRPPPCSQYLWKHWGFYCVCSPLPGSLLFQSVLLQQDSLNWVILLDQNVFVHSSRGWKFQYQCTNTFGGLFLQNGILNLCASEGNEGFIFMWWKTERQRDKRAVIP